MTDMVTPETGKAAAAAPGTPPIPGSAGGPAETRGASAGPGLVARFGLIGAFVLAFLVFGIARPTTFLTLDNMTSILLQAAPSLVIAVFLTVVLVMKDFDLSFGSVISLGAGTAVILMSKLAFPPVAAILIALAFGLGVGLVNGVLVAYLGGSSFVITLAMGTIVAGAEFAITDQASIFDGIPAGFAAIGQGSRLGMNNLVWIAVVVAVIIAVVLERTELGRYMYATGGNPDAARLAGVRTRQLRLIGFALLGLGAAGVGIMLSAQAASYTPSIGGAYLLPAFAAAFLGTAVFKPGEFTVAGTVVGVLFLGMVQTGLTMLNLETYAINLVQGAILVVGVLVSRLERRSLAVPRTKRRRRAEARTTG
ncbi:ABC transporter permease [Pseudonocardia sp. RS010]|uniref:ABC transporter permease n=1 Tax=Pseudonocardia sp. RS010 TaxID=3385979 RepID=UPI0039A25496